MSKSKNTSHILNIPEKRIVYMMKRTLIMFLVSVFLYIAS